MSSYLLWEGHVCLLVDVIHIIDINVVCICDDLSMTIIRQCMNID